ncbi:hypothetical protein Tco_0360058 [Tanacetum coccineum]
MRAHRPEELADIRRAKIVKGVTGGPNQKGIGQIPTKMISPSLGRSAAKTLTGNARVWFDKLPKESIDSYEDLRAALERYKAEVLDVEGAPECMKISGFMHGIIHPELIKSLYEKILRSMDEIYRVTTSFLQGEVAAFSHSRKKAPTPWRQPKGGNKPNFKKGFKNKQMSDWKPANENPERNFALEKGKFKAPPPMVTPAEKRDPNKYCEFHTDTGHNTDECMQLRR